MSDPFGNNLLALVVFLPLLGAFLLLFFPRPADEAEDHGHHDTVQHDQVGTDEDAPIPAKPSSAAATVRGFTLAWTLLTFALSLLLLARYEPGRAGMQIQVGPFAWISEFKINFHLGVDGISLLLILLTTFLSALSVGFSFNVKRRVKEYMVFLLVLETAMMGVFCALDLVLFYIFWEAVLIPMYFLIGIWGHENRTYAAIKFFLYTFAASILMLVGIVYIYAHTNTFSLVELMDASSNARRSLAGLGPQVLSYLFFAFALAFMVKVPMFPFHTWLPDAHVEAPTAGSVILAGVMLKMGTYGFIRFCLPIFPDQAREHAWIFITLAVIGIIYGAIVATMQPDMKKLVAYSSVSHLGFVMLGIFSFTDLGLTGAVLQSINHGISTGMLFFLVGMLYDRRHTRLIAAFGGLKRVVPTLSTFFLIALLSSVALPLTNGFVGEFTILQGSYTSNSAGPGWTAAATFGMVLSAVYMLWLFQRVFTGPVDKEPNLRLPDLSLREKAVLAPLVAMVFWFGCYVTTWTQYLNIPVASVRDAVMVDTVAPGKPMPEPAQPGRAMLKIGMRE